jgi:hypothetical protein
MCPGEPKQKTENANGDEKNGHAGEGLVTTIIGMSVKLSINSKHQHFEFQSPVMCVLTHCSSVAISAIRPSMSATQWVNPMLFWGL